MGQKEETPRGSCWDTHLGGSHQLGCAGSDFVGADDQFLVFPCVQDNPVSRLPVLRVRREIVSETVHDRASADSSSPANTLRNQQLDPAAL